MARRFVVDLREGLGDRSIRATARAADISEGTIRSILVGSVWPLSVERRILERAAASGRLQTLGREELELDVHPCTTDPRPKPVKAWVRFGDSAFQVTAEACMWTSNAIAVRFKVAEREYRCWVWQGAVEEAVARPS